ncbi:MAG TPA: hypothetical protein VFW00_00970, partial [Rhodocyclaceae bacterium]|nr:hypothetical protein [Rhodocyclaceae bacterium]
IAATQAPVVTSAPATPADQNVTAPAAAPVTTTTDQTDAATAALLQNLQQDPAQGNILFNPFYAASIAAYRQSDLISPASLPDANALAIDFPAPVLPVTAARHISEYA